MRFCLWAPGPPSASRRHRATGSSCHARWDVVVRPGVDLWSQRSDVLPAHSSFSRLFHSFRIACLRCFLMRRGLSDSKMSSIVPMPYLSTVSCAFMAHILRTLRAHWRLSRIARLLFLLMAILHKSVRMAMCSRAGRGSWFAMRYAVALEHLVGRPGCSLRMEIYVEGGYSVDGPFV